MKPRKPKARVEESSLLDQLSKPLRDFVTDFKTHGVDTLEQVRKRSPEKYIELSTKLIGLIAALKTAPDDCLNFDKCNSMKEIGLRLLQSVGHTEGEVTDDMIEQALALNNTFIAGLEAIRAKAEGEIH
jgi:hypothetical protein